jgi:DNA-binding NarL/FixJ family response regulator
MKDVSDGKIRIIIVDDHEIFRSGLKSLIEQENIGQVIGEACNGAEFLKIIEKVTPDLVLMDIDMPVMNGVEATEQALKMNPGLNILVLSMYNDYAHYSLLLGAGAKGFISKSSGKLGLQRGILAVSSGENFFSSDLLKNIIVEINKSKEKANHKESDITFTEREEEILKLICNGFDTNEIAGKLFISHKTVDNHRSKLLQKAGVKNSVGLVVYAIKNELVSF